MNKNLWFSKSIQQEKIDLSDDFSGLIYDYYLTNNGELVLATHVTSMDENNSTNDSIFVGIGKFIKSCSQLNLNCKNHGFIDSRYFNIWDDI